jgi:hypothetical protein
MRVVCFLKASRRVAACLSFVLLGGFAHAQFDPSFKTGSTIKLNDDGSHYLKFTLTNQIWFRYNQSNPGSTIDGTPKNETFDIGIRRSRIQMFGALNKRSFVYVQLGMNNFNHLSDRKLGLFFHDVVADYQVFGSKLSIGGGLTNWVGLSRISNASIITFMPMDSPIFPFATIDATDQFNRKLSIYAKGKLGKLDYRLSVSDPMEFEKSPLFNSTTAITSNANFAPGAAHKQYQAYVMYQFKDQESNLAPYLNGCYLGDKSVFNIGAGFDFQHNAMWRKNEFGDTLRSDMGLFAIDLFWDKPLNAARNSALTMYAAGFFNNYGKGYLRTLGIMNPANGTISSQASYNGAGNAAVLFGNGQIIYLQTGWLLGTAAPEKAKVRFQPYAGIQYGVFNRIKGSNVITDTGINFYLNKHNSKISLNWQSRPVYDGSDPENLKNSGRKNCVTMQLQVAI